MTAKKPSSLDAPGKTGPVAAVLPTAATGPGDQQPRAAGEGMLTAFGAVSIGMGLALQSATPTGAATLATSGTAEDGSAPDGLSISSAAAIPESAADVTVLAAMVPLDAVPAPTAGLVLPVATSAPVEAPPVNVPVFAQNLGARDYQGAGDTPVTIAHNATVPVAPVSAPVRSAVEAQPVANPGREVLTTDPVAPSTGDGPASNSLDPLPTADTPLGNVLDPLLGEDGLITGVIGTVNDGVLDPLLGEDGLVSSILDPLIGADGLLGQVVGTVADDLLDPLLGNDGIVGGLIDTLLGEDGLLDTVLTPVLGEDGLVDTVLDPLLGEGGLVGTVVDTVLDPLLADGGIVSDALNPILGEGGLVDALVDPLLGEDGVLSEVVDTLTAGVVEPLLGSDGVLGTVLDPLLGEDGVLTDALDPLLGEDGIVETALDPLLGDDGLLPQVLDPLLGEDGLLGNALDPLVGSGGVLDTVLTPVLDATGPVGGLVDNVLGGLFSGWRNRDTTPPAATTPTVATPDDAALAATGGVLAEDLVAALTSEDDLLDTLIGDIGNGALLEGYDGLADALSLSGDSILTDLLSGEAPLVTDLAGAGEDLLGALLGVSLSGALAESPVLGLGPEGAADPELDDLLNEILDSGERAVSGVLDPVGELLDGVTEDLPLDDLAAALDLDVVVDGALETLFGAGVAELDLAGSLAGPGGLLGGLGLFTQDDDNS